MAWGTVGIGRISVSVVNSTDHSPRSKKNRPRSNGRCGGAGGLAGHQVAGGPSVPSLGVEPSWRPCPAARQSRARQRRLPFLVNTAARALTRVAEHELTAL